MIKKIKNRLLNQQINQQNTAIDLSFKKPTELIQFDKNNNMEQQWQKFKSNKLGYLSFCLLLVVLLICMFANVIANDKPLVVHFNDSWYFPILVDYPETTFGGDFETVAVYKDPYVKELISKDGFMVMPPIQFSDSTVSIELSQPYPAPPNQHNLLGTDDVGRDILARVIYGIRISLLFGILLTLCGSLIGIVIGAIQGFYGGKIDMVGQRLLEIWLGMPQLFIIMIVMSLFNPSVYLLFAVMLLFGWSGLVNLVRLECLKLRNQPFVLAAKNLGLTNAKIIRQHILPNALASSLSQLPFILIANIIALTSLDFLGYGLPLGSASLGELLLQGKNNLDAPWIVLSGFFSLTILLSLLLFIGEALRDMFDVH